MSRRWMLLNSKRTMAVFKQLLNPLKGQTEWASHDELYDYHQEVANAGFGDMLHDTERNQKYYAAIRKAIKKMHETGREAHVLDIGTGTGILSMMSVESGADTVTACEAFLPMANCAEKIFQAHGMQNKVKLIKKRSTEVTVGTDMTRRANLLVAELLDTELIGEGAINIYNHAHKNLLTEDVVCIPSKAYCYAQVVQSPLAAQWNSLKSLPNLDGEILLSPPDEIAQCRGETNLHDVQLSQMPQHSFKCLTKPIKIFEFDFSSKRPMEARRTLNETVEACASGQTDLVFYWWEITMDNEGEILLSCAPFWAHPSIKELNAKLRAIPREMLPSQIPWRDHWMQAVYYIPKPLRLGVGEKFLLNCNHDEYSVWFDAFPQAAGKNLDLVTLPRPQCSCLLHITYSRSRIGQMNQSVRNKRFLKYLEEEINPSSRVLVLGDGCYIGLAASALGAKSVWCHEPNRSARRFTEAIVKRNRLQNVEFIEKLEDIETTVVTRQLTHIFAEPYFLTSILPWDNFYFGFLINQIKCSLPETIKLSPHAARIYAMPVEFLDLHKLRKPVGRCEGFDLSLFDEMVEKSAAVSQTHVEAHPLWEYPCRALALPSLLMEVDFFSYDTDKLLTGKIPIEMSSVCNGVALWVEWLIDKKTPSPTTVSSGPTKEVVIGELVQWDMFVRQGVCLFDTEHFVQRDSSFVEWNVIFKPAQGVLELLFGVHSCS